MTLTCAVNGEPEKQDHPIFVCHHCGKPVCADHGWVLPADYAFDDSGEESGKRLWQRIIDWHEWRPRRAPQSAMHCDECRKEYHPAESMHHGWVSPKAAKRMARAQATPAASAAKNAPPAAPPASAGNAPPAAPPARPLTPGRTRPPTPGQARQPAQPARPLDSGTRRRGSRERTARHD